MKKTIAKIMAAAMLLSAIPAVTLPTLTAEAGYLYGGDGYDVVTPSDVVVKNAYWYQSGAINSSNYTSTSPLDLTGLEYNFTSVSKNGDTKDTGAYIDTKLGAEIVAFAQKGTSKYGTTRILGSVLDSTANEDGEVVIDQYLTKLFRSSDITWTYADKNEVKYIQDIGFWGDDEESTLTIEVRNTDAALAKARALQSGSESSIIEITANLNTDHYTSTLHKVKSISIWVRLGAGDGSTNGNGYAVLKKDNNSFVKIGLTYTLDANNYATIVTVDDLNTLTLDTAKGGRMLLDYVYKTGAAYDGTAGQTNRDNASVSANSNAFKIRRIGSRVFKGAKFQQISGWGDDGAKYIRTINNGAFRKCKQLKKVNLDTDKKIRKINAKAFYDCKKLATVKLDGRNLKQIGSDAFKGTKSNITFKIKGNASQVKKAWAKIKKQAPKKAKYSKI